MNIENATPASVTLVAVQSVECYGENYYKFKGGLAVIVRTIHEATAMGLTCKWLTEQGLSAGYYPRHAELFASEAEAIASLPEWDNEVDAILG